MQNPRVAIVILNWNGRHYLEKFLPSVLASTYSNIEVVVADNGSTDDSIDFLRATYPSVTLLAFEKNHGFTSGYNLALKQVSAPYYILLNSDVEVEPGWIEPMVTLLENNQAIGACQPKLRAYQHREQFEYAGAAGGWIDRYGYPFSRGRVFESCETDNGQYDDAAPVFWASGAALFIRSEVFHAEKGFDDFFFAHMEEIDLCWRIQLSGKQVWSCPSSVVYHVGGGTLPRGNSRKTFLNFRNNHIMLWKNLRPLEKMRVLPVRLVLDGVTGMKSLFSGDSGSCIAIVRAHWAFFGWLARGRKTHYPNRIAGARPAGLLYKNLVWLHFVRKKKTFSEIVGRWL
ncbi:MAG: glycosyltransferase family 2 protein [Chitinophagaceae bacterium]|nr:MAG: glycosyltransferase family 2 protein [Chitinophagaceae bacterium]